MMAGEETPVLRRCITCFACNELCPRGANPFDLICALQEKYDVFKSQEMASAQEASYAFNKPLTSYPRAERVMSTCLFEKTHAHLVQGQLYDLPRVTGKPYFCWMLFGHWGAQRIQRKHARELVDRLALTGAREIVCFHDDCYAMLTALAPGYGIEAALPPGPSPGAPGGLSEGASSPHQAPRHQRRIPAALLLPLHAREGALRG